MIWFKAEETLTEERIQHALRNVIRNGVASQVMGILTAGIFLVTFTVKLGTSNLVISLLAAIGPLAQLLQLLPVSIVEKIHNRRLITVVAAAISKLCCWTIVRNRNAS